MDDGTNPLDLVEDLIAADDLAAAVAAVANLHIADGARVLENLGRESQALIAGRLPPDHVGQVLEHFDIEDAVDL